MISHMRAEVETGELKGTEFSGTPEVLFVRTERQEDAKNTREPFAPHVFTIWGSVGFRGYI